MINNFNPDHYIIKRKEELTGVSLHSHSHSPATTPSQSFFGGKVSIDQIDETDEKIIKNDDCK